jgi:Yip1 domain
MPLAAIGPVAGFVGSQLFGIGVFSDAGPQVSIGLTIALTSFIMAIVSLIVVSLIADFLAPKFDGQSNRTQALKLVAYSMTPGWIAGVLNILPGLGLVALLASLYGIYLFYKGASPLLKVPEAKAGGFTVVTVVCNLIVSLVLGSLFAAVAMTFGVGAAALGSIG